MQRGQACVLLLAAFAAVAVSARPQRELKQVEFFYNTPAAAGSTSVDVNGGLALSPDGTIDAAAGGNIATTTAISNPILNALTGGAYKNRPTAATTAYTQIPLSLFSSLYPTLSYGAADGKGDLLSTSNGAWGNAEFGYNPINNNLGGSVSTGTAGSTGLLGSDVIGPGPDRGKSSIKYAGYANSRTNAADARTDQSAQATAGPFNALAPQNTLTCTQALLYGVALTQYDLGAPVAPLPREGGASIIPFCLSLFNFATLDDFSEFVNNQGQNTTLGVPGTSSTNTGASADNDSVSATGPILRPLPGSAAARAAAAEPSKATAPAGQAPAGGVKPVTFSSVVTEALTSAPDAVQQLAQTPLFQALLERVQTNPLVEAFDGANQLFAKQASKVAQSFAAPVANLNAAMANLTRSVVSGVGNAGVKGAVATLEAAEPLIGAVAGANKAIQPAAKASKAVSSKLAAQSEKMVEESIKKLPAEQQKEVRAAVQQGGSGKGAAVAQAGRRMKL